MKGLTASQFDKICRTCLSQSEEIARIFEVTYDNIHLWEIFRSCLAIEIEKGDTLPQHICKSCIMLLVQVHMFIQQCQQSDAVLRTLLKKHNEGIQSPHDNEDNQESCDFETDSKDEIKDDLSADLSDHIEYVQEEDQTVNEAAKKPVKHVYYCSYCSESFSSYHELTMHRQQVKHPRPRNHKCPECSKRFSYSHLKQHMRTHTKEKPFICQVCQTSFSLKCNLRRHMMIHTGERPHTCDVCGKGFIQATTLAEHRRLHTGETPFVCSYCGLTFSQAAKHKSHLRLHILKSRLVNKTSEKDKSASYKFYNFECDVCLKSFTSRGVLKTHRLTHGEKSFLCSHCGKGFVSNAGLLSHMKVHTGDKPYTCSLCKKTFSQLGSMKSHMLIHTGEKPFACKVCSKAFTQRSHLKYHMRTHSGERPYACAYCGKAFALKGTLTVHTRTHTGETPYTCDVCGKGFYDSSSMKKHRKGHGGNKDKNKVDELESEASDTKVY